MASNWEAKVAAQQWPGHCRYVLDVHLSSITRKLTCPALSEASSCTDVECKVMDGLDNLRMSHRETSPPGGMNQVGEEVGVFAWGQLLPAALYCFL